ncbi:MAG TPA: Ni/Fe hydrogenase subunit alpha [Acidobacteriota bacterium]|nr:Ni/Fe hydrogenase subunit alpha [Acidobacteriota bacterium]
MTRTITVDHLARVEGHGGITVVLDGNQVSEVQFDIFEGIRLFEGLVRGRSMEDVTGIVSRICAICSHGHSITSLLALENALGVPVTQQTRLLRELAYHGSNIESHALHVFFLALPDLVGHPSVVSLAGVMPDAVRMALRLKKLGNTIQEVVGGRAVHPVNYVIGGFGRVPGTDELVALKKEITAGLADCERTMEVLGTVNVPSIAREPVRCAALLPEDEGLFFGNTILISDRGSVVRIPVRDYRTLTNEHCVAYSHAKHSEHDNKSYMVGALARLTLNGDRVDGMARKAWEKLGLAVPPVNIVMNNIAQAVEMIYSVERSLRIVNRLIAEGIREEAPADYRPHACAGAAATEVPRGTLFYSYELDDQGRVLSADVITPTAQNLSNAEDQMRAVVKQSVGVSDGLLAQWLQIVARAYDPCISCSVHVIRTAE